MLGNTKFNPSLIEDEIYEEWTNEAPVFLQIYII